MHLRGSRYVFICLMHFAESSARGCDEVRMRRSNAADLCVIDLQHAVVGEEPVHLRLDVAHLQVAWTSPLRL